MTWWISDAQLDDDQLAVHNLPLGKSYLVGGPPGSGKTNLLLLRASYLSGTDTPNVVVLTFTKTLRNFVARGAHRYLFHPENIRTIVAWERNLLRENNVPLPTSSTDLIGHRKELVAEIKALLAAKPRLRKQFDCIFVDEIQDCLPDEIDIFFELGRTVFFTGHDAQQIFPCDGESPRLSPPHLETHKLRYHYRSGRRICQAADVVGQILGEPDFLATCNYNEAEDPSNVDFIPYSSLDEVIGAVTLRLRLQLETYTDSDELIGVITPKAQTADALRRALEATDLVDHLFTAPSDLADSSDVEKRIFVGTTHQSKGLEFKAAHLVALEDVVPVGRKDQKRLAFMSLTRAQTSLTVYHRNLPPYLKKVEVAVNPPKHAPNPLSVFPARRPRT